MQTRGEIIRPECAASSLKAGSDSFVTYATTVHHGKLLILTRNTKQMISRFDLPLMLGSKSIRTRVYRRWHKRLWKQFFWYDFSKSSRKSIRCLPFKHKLVKPTTNATSAPSDLFNESIRQDIAQKVLVTSSAVVSLQWKRVQLNHESGKWRDNEGAVQRLQSRKFMLERLQMELRYDIYLINHLNGTLNCFLCIFWVMLLHPSDKVGQNDEPIFATIFSFMV